MRIRIVFTLLAASWLGMHASAEQQGPRDDAYRSQHRPASIPTSLDQPIKDDPAGRREALKEQFGGEFTPEFMEALMNAANQQVAEYGPLGRGGIKVPPGGEWTNVGPYRSDWIQNGVRVNESDTGRVRTFLVHPTNPDIVYVLKSSGGLWKTTNFYHPRPKWRPMSDELLSLAVRQKRFTLVPAIRSILEWEASSTSRRMAVRHGDPVSSSAPRRSSTISRSTPVSRQRSCWSGRTRVSSAP